MQEEKVDGNIYYLPVVLYLMLQGRSVAIGDCRFSMHQGGHSDTREALVKPSLTLYRKLDSVPVEADEGRVMSPSVVELHARSRIQ